MFFNKKPVILFFIVATLFPSVSFAGGNVAGITLGATRVVYTQGQKQSSVSVRNFSADSRYMVQSWVEDASGKKSADFIVTPPIYVSNPGSQNDLRLMYVGKALPVDRETLYYVVAKAIPAIDKDKVAGKNVLLLSTATRIKMFMRPEKLGITPDAAVKKLQFEHRGKDIHIHNPTPYYITLTDITAGTENIKTSVMVPPFGEGSVKLHNPDAHTLKFKIINDYGGFSKRVEIKL
ncbi:fimbria/pilus periplasmic chaperone [Enterobacter cancerogenus]